jgi:hypothetical protein
MRKLIFRVIERAVIFLSLWIFAALFLFVQGNFRHFSDENLRAILRAASIGGVLLLFAIATFLISGIIAGVTKQCKVWPRIVLALPGTIIAFLALYASQIIEILSDGILPWEF